MMPSLSALDNLRLRSAMEEAADNLQLTAVNLDAKLKDLAGAMEDVHAGLQLARLIVAGLKCHSNHLRVHAGRVGAALPAAAPPAAPPVQEDQRRPGSVWGAPGEPGGPCGPGPYSQDQPWQAGDLALCRDGSNGANFLIAGERYVVESVQLDQHGRQRLNLVGMARAWEAERFFRVPGHAAKEGGAS